MRPIRHLWLLLLALTACSEPTSVPPAAGVMHLLPEFRGPEGEPLPVERVTLRGIGREAVRVAAGATAVARIVVPPGAALRFAVTHDGPQRASAEVRIRSGRREEAVWRAEVEQRAVWAPGFVDLAAYAGKSVEVRFHVAGESASHLLWGSAVITADRGDRTNLLLYEIDTLRADLLEPYGYPGRSSPWIGRLSRGGTLFQSCQATASWTRPSAASILTSRSAPSLGMVGERSRMPADVATLTRILRDAGWYTVAFQTNPNAGRAAGMDRDFDLTLEMNGLLQWPAQRPAQWQGGTLGTGSASGTTELIAFALAELLPDWRELPLFLYIHPMDPHTPYEPRSPFREIPGLDRQIRNPRQEDFRAYARDVRAGDHFLGSILKNLEAEGVLERTVVAYVSDHGEEFGEHGGRGHGRNLFVETLRVPFVLAGLPAVPAGRVVRERVSTLDLMPTALDLLGVEAPPGLEGRSLVPRMTDPDPGPPFPETDAYAHVIGLQTRINDEAMEDPDLVGHIAILTGPWKYVLVDYGPARRQNQLFDLRTDPGETRNLREEYPERVRELEARARAWWDTARAGRDPGEAAVDIDPELEDQLRALGYVE